MNVGMLWFDDNQTRTLEEKVRRAAAYYRKKYGRKPDLCLINPQSGNGRTKAVGSIQLLALPDVLPYHFMMGISENGSGAKN